MYGGTFGASQGGQAFGLGFGSPSQANPNDSSGKKARTEEKLTCLPVTIRAIESALAQREDGELRFYGTEPGMLVLVAAIETIVKQAASLEMVLNDGTGRIKARHYFTDSQPEDLDQLEAGRYVSLFGAVRSSPEPHVAAQGLRAVQSADEISYHMIESAHAALKLQRGKALTTMPSPKKSSVSVADKMEVTPSKEASPWATSPAPAAAASPAPAAVPEVKPAMRARLEGAALRAAVLAFVTRAGEGKEEGVALEAICEHVEPSPRAEVAELLQTLVGEGEMINTIDDDHFSCDI